MVEAPRIPGAYTRRGREGKARAWVCNPPPQPASPPTQPTHTTTTAPQPPPRHQPWRPPRLCSSGLPHHFLAPFPLTLFPTHPDTPNALHMSLHEREQPACVAQHRTTCHRKVPASQSYQFSSQLVPAPVLTVLCLQYLHPSTARQEHEPCGPHVHPTHPLTKQTRCSRSRSPAAAVAHAGRSLEWLALQTQYAFAPPPHLPITIPPIPSPSPGMRSQSCTHVCRHPARPCPPPAAGGVVDALPCHHQAASRQPVPSPAPTDNTNLLVGSSQTAR